MDNNFDLKSFRESSLKLTQAEFANLISVRQDAISRWEKNPEQISLQILQTIAQKTGMTLDQLVSYRKPMPRPLEVEFTWNQVKYAKSALEQYIKEFMSQDTDGVQNKFFSMVAELNQTVEKATHKPQIVFVGHSDSGKSTMINALIGKEKMPTRWTPTTSIIVYIKHIEDRPSYIEEELWIMRKGDNDEIWDDTRLQDEVYCREWKLAGGSAEMLAMYGTRHGDNFNEDAVGSAVLFVDSDILKNCDLLDVPGFTGGIESDNRAAHNAKNRADILVYLSQASGFMRSEDFSYLKDALKCMPIVEHKDNEEMKPLANMFIVATQAHIIDHGNAERIKGILDDGSSRFYDTLTEKFWIDRENISGLSYTEADLRARFFAYTTDIDLVRKNFEDELKLVVEEMPKLILRRLSILIENFRNQLACKVLKDIDMYQNMIREREKYEHLLEEMEKQEPIRKMQVMEEKANLFREIRKCSSRSRDEFQKKYDSILADSHILEIIEKKAYKSKKEDMQRLCSYISSQLEDGLQVVLEQESKRFGEAVEAFLTKYDQGCKAAEVTLDGINMTDFNTRRAFAAGLGGAAVYGGLALWSSTMGNLGAYILIAKGVSVLSTLGISVGGTSAAISAVAAIGGPAVLGIALATVAALGVFGVFSNGWKKKATKKLREAYMDQNALQKYYKCIDDFWNDTEVAFEEATVQMEKEWSRSVDDLRDTMENYDIDLLHKHIEQAQDIQQFLKNLPL